MQNNTHSSDAIDLFELCSILWKRKLTIITLTSISIIFAAIYSFTAKEEWISEARLIQPNEVQLGKFLEVKQGYSRLISDGEVSIDASPEAMQKGRLRFISGDNLNVDELLKNVYKTLIVTLNAEDNKLNYLQDSDYFKQQAMKISDDIEKQKMLVAMSTNDLQVKEIVKNNMASIDVSFAAETASDAQKTLQGYIESTNKLVMNKLFDSLRLQINERILTLDNEANNLKKQTEQNRKNQVMLLKQAIVAAKDANIIEYTGENVMAGNTIIDLRNTDSMFLLGEKYLIAQLKSLESSPIVYPISYFQTLKNISGLKQLLEFEPKGITFEYTRTPTQPLVKDKPRKSIIIILGALFGGILGCGVVLVQSAVKNRKYKS